MSRMQGILRGSRGRVQMTRGGLALLVVLLIGCDRCSPENPFGDCAPPSCEVLTPEVAEARRELAIGLDKRDRARYEPAMAVLLAVEHVHPEEARTVGRAWLRLGNPSKALEACERGLKRLPDDAGLARCKIRALEELKRATEAREFAEAYLANAPGDPSRHVALAKVLESHSPNDALSHVKEAMLLIPIRRAAFPLVQKGVTAPLDEDAEELLTLYERLIRRTTKDAEKSRSSGNGG